MIQKLSILTQEEKQSLCKRSQINYSEILETIKKIEKEIIKKGDQALKEITKKFDNFSLESFQVSTEDYQKSEEKIPQKLKDAIKVAQQNIEKFHRETSVGTALENKISNQTCPPQIIQTTPGVICYKESRPLESVLLYIPGGKSPLFSTLLMSAIPAKIAGVKNVYITTPPNPSPEILYTAKFLGIPAKNIYQLGGAQAILAFTHGTKFIPKVDKIFGPGNAYVTAAKMHAQSQGTAIDMPAGPSEVFIITDQKSDPEIIAIDALSQIEHGPTSEAIICTPNKNQSKKIQEKLKELNERISPLPWGEAGGGVKILIYSSIEEALNFSNQYAPEHLLLNIEEPEKYTQKIHHAGSVFLGRNACESFGDYASGTNHILPTSGFARSYSGVSVQSFQKNITFQKISDQGLKNLGPTVEILSQAEDLPYHKEAISIRLKKS